MPQSQWLGRYAAEFDVLEVNSTYYGIMSPRTAASMVDRTPEGFGFFVKLHASMTHGRDADGGTWRSFGEMLAPFREAGRLEGLLAQFPWSFRPSEEALSHIGGVMDRAGGVPVAVETRNADWHRDGWTERISGLGAAAVSVDLPDLPGLPPSVPVGGAPFGYVRFHGRNSEHWWGGGPLRYDYGYGEDELRSWLPGIADLSRRAGRVFVFFNNCHGAQAVDSARMMRDLLEGE